MEKADWEGPRDWMRRARRKKKKNPLVDRQAGLFDRFDRRAGVHEVGPEGWRCARCVASLIGPGTVSCASCHFLLLA